MHRHSLTSKTQAPGLRGTFNSTTTRQRLTGLHAALPEVQIRSMSYCMGPKACEILASTMLGEADVKELAAVKKAFWDDLMHPLNELYMSELAFITVPSSQEKQSTHFSPLSNLW